MKTTDQRPPKPLTKREFIWKNGVREFGLPVGLVSSAWIQITNADPDAPVVAVILGILGGAAIGALVGGWLFGWAMWQFFGARDLENR